MTLLTVANTWQRKVQEQGGIAYNNQVFAE